MSFEYITKPLTPGAVNLNACVVDGGYSVICWASLEEGAPHPRVMVIGPDARPVASANLDHDSWVVDCYSYECAPSAYRFVANVLESITSELSHRLHEARYAKGGA